MIAGEKYYLVLELRNRGSKLAIVNLIEGNQHRIIRVEPVSVEKKTLTLYSAEPVELFVNYEGSSVPVIVNGEMTLSVKPTRNEEVQAFTFGQGKSCAVHSLCRNIGN